MKKTLIVIMAAIISAAVGCSSAAPPESSSGSATLHLAISDDSGGFDPDTYYGAEGLIITQSTYETLLTYKPNSPDLVGLLAESWTVSPDGLAYTFTLRPGVKFSDGTPFTAEAAKASFQRRIDLKGGPSYMLDQVLGMQTPTPSTFVVTLKKPQSPFLDYLASPYGPMMISPAIVATNRGSDNAASYLATHSAGTGPYVLTEAQPATKYVLTANPDYWGQKASYTTVDIAVLSDFSTQRIEFESGQLDMLFRGPTTQDIKGYQSDPKYQVQFFPALFQTTIYADPQSAVFGDKTRARALFGALDKQSLTAAVFGDRGVAAKELYPAGMVADPVTYSVESNGTGLQAAVASMKGEKVVVGFNNDGALGQMAELIQAQLSDAGLDATSRGYTSTQSGTFAGSPSDRPDLFLSSLNPDAANPDTYGRLYFYTGGAVNYLGGSVPAADVKLDEAAGAVSPTAAASASRDAEALYQDSGLFAGITNLRDAVIAKKGISGFVHQLPWINLVRLASLSPS